MFTFLNIFNSFLRITEGAHVVCCTEARHTHWLRAKTCKDVFNWLATHLSVDILVFFVFFFPAIGLLGETRRHSGSFLIKRWYSVLCHFLQGTSHFSVLDIKWVSVTQVPGYLHSFMCPGEPWSSYSSFVHCSWYQ